MQLPPNKLLLHKHIIDNLIFSVLYFLCFKTPEIYFLCCSKPWIQSSGKSFKMNFHKPHPNTRQFTSVKSSRGDWWRQQEALAKLSFLLGDSHEIKNSNGHRFRVHKSHFPSINSVGRSGLIQQKLRGKGSMCALGEGVTNITQIQIMAIGLWRG